MLPLVCLVSQTSYVREDAGTHRYNVGTDTPKLCATTVMLPVRSWGQEYRGLLHLRREVCCRDLAEIVLTVPSGSPVPYAIFRAPIPASWFSETIEANRTYFPLNHAVSV